MGGRAMDRTDAIRVISGLFAAPLYVCAPPTDISVTSNDTDEVLTVQHFLMCRES